MALKQLVVAEDGMEAVEYAIIMGLLVAAALIALAAIGAWVLSVFEGFQTGVGA